MADITFITTNYNSSNYIVVAMLSLYSVFKAAEKFTAPAKVLLVDSASTDGSFEKLRDLGMEMSKRTGVEFEYARLSRDLGNSFALAYGTLLAKRRGSRYAFTVDNDYVLLDLDAPLKMVDIAEKLRRRFRIYSVGAFHYEVDRDLVRSKCDVQEPTLVDIESLYAELKGSVHSLKHAIATSNVNYVDVLGRPVIVPRFVSAQLIERLLNWLRSNRKHAVFLSSYVASTFALYNCKCAPVIPYLYIYGDDQLTGMEHAKRGYLNLVVPVFAGAHLSIDRSKASPRKEYFKARKYVLVTSAKKRSARLFHYFIGLSHFSLIYPLLNLVSAKTMLVNSSIRKELGDSGAQVLIADIKDFKMIRMEVLGAVHGLLSARRFRKIVDRWFDAYLEEGVGESTLHYVLLDVTRWAGRPSLKDLLLYVYPGPKLSRPRREMRIFMRRIVGLAPRYKA